MLADQTGFFITAMDVWNRSYSSKKCLYRRKTYGLCLLSRCVTAEHKLQERLPIYDVRTLLIMSTSGKKSIDKAKEFIAPKTERQ